jgi:hypothetical protein
MRAKRARDLADSHPERALYFVAGRGLTKGIGTNTVIAVWRQNQPVGPHLSNFLRQSHSPQQIGGALPYR